MLRGSEALQSSSLKISAAGHGGTCQDFNHSIQKAKAEPGVLAVCSRPVYIGRLFQTTTAAIIITMYVNG